MAFKTIINGTDELSYMLHFFNYECTIGFLSIQKKPIDHLSTGFSVGKVNYNLTTQIAVHPDSKNVLVPYKKITRKLPPGCIVQVQNPAQLVIKAGKRKYIISKGKDAHDQSIYIDTEQERNSMNLFKKSMFEYGALLSSTVEGLLGKVPYEYQYYLELDSREKDRLIDIETAQQSTTSTISDLEKRILLTDNDVGFDQIGGARDAKRDILQIYEDMVRPEIGSYLGRNPSKSKGFIISGESGCGKTLLVKALATKLAKSLGPRIKIYSVNYEDITSTFRGGEAVATGNIFHLAKQNAAANIRTLIFLDEIHGVGQRKESSMVSNEALDSMLAHLSGINEIAGLTVIGATYMPIESLDPALLRPGRLETQIAMKNPDKEERKDILTIYINKNVDTAAKNGNPQLFGDIQLDSIADAMQGMNGSHIAEIVEKVARTKEQQIRGLLQKSGELPEYITPFYDDAFLKGFEAEMDKLSKKIKPDVMQSIVQESFMKKVNEQAKIVHDIVGKIFVPINTEDFIAAIQSYEKKKRFGKIGFSTA